MIGFNNTFFCKYKKKKQILFKKHHLFFAYYVIGIAVGGGVCYIWGIYSF